MLDIEHIAFIKTLCDHHFYADRIERLLHDLSLAHMRLIDEHAVKTHHLPAVRADHDILDAAKHFLDDRHGAPAWAWRSIPGCQVTEAVTNERLISTRERRHHHLTDLTGLARR